MIVLLSWAGAAPTTVVTFDNGGFNLPLYTGRWNGEFSQPSVAQQLAGDIARLQGRSPRVFTYLPPGRSRGRSSDPFEVLPHAATCARPAEDLEKDDPCFCAPGDRCWEGLEANRDPAASTSLFQAATAMRERVGSGARIEIHFTDLFEEDPNSADNLADADRCVTPAGTRKALEAVLRPTQGSVDHVAVGMLTASIAPPRTAVGGAVRFVEQEGGCWSARRTRTFGGSKVPLEMAMGVVVLGVNTAADDAWVGQFIEGLERQISEPLALDLVVVREPVAEVTLGAQVVGADVPVVQLPALPKRSTPCESISTATSLFSAGEPLLATVAGGCGQAGDLTLPPAELRRAFYSQAGLNPTQTGVHVAGALELKGDHEAIRRAVYALPDAHPVADRPLPFWGSMTEALRFEDEFGVWAPRAYRIRVEDLDVGGLDDRPWVLAAVVGLLLGAITTTLLSLGFARFAANRAFRRHLGSSRGRPVAAILAEAAEEARAGWALRLALAVGLSSFVAVAAGLVVLLVHGARVG